MKTLFGVNINWPFYFILALIIRLAFVDMSWYSYFAIIISIWQFMLLFQAIGYVIPVRYLLGSFMCLQFFVGSAFAYNGLDQYQYFYYVMRVPEAEYYLYVIPAVLLFIFGLHLGAGKLMGENVDVGKVKQFVRKNPRIPYVFIVLGFVSSIIAGFFSSEFAFVFYLLGSFKFIGLFLLVLGSDQLKFWPMLIVMGSIVSSSFGSGMFHDLLTWIIFTASVFTIKYRFSLKTKLIGTLCFIILVSIIQVMKGSYRESLGGNDEQAGIEAFAELAQEQNEEKGLLSFDRLASSNVRINQGFIITNILETVPQKVPYQNGKQMLQLFEAGILPRILAPNKLRAGDRDIFMKYSGIPIREGTSMALSSIGDAYINFGTWGGCVFMFLLGAMYNYILCFLGKKANRFPVLILFTTLVFYYPIRPDCELQTILGHIFKSCFLIYIMIEIWKYIFKYQPERKRPIEIIQ